MDKLLRIISSLTMSQAIVCAGITCICIVALYSCAISRINAGWVPCVLDKDVMCMQRLKCKQCMSCKPGKDQCCCLHTDKCVCTDDINKENCCVD